MTMKQIGYKKVHDAYGGCCDVNGVIISRDIFPYIKVDNINIIFTFDEDLSSILKIRNQLSDCTLIAMQLSQYIGKVNRDLCIEDNMPRIIVKSSPNTLATVVDIINGYVDKVAKQTNINKHRLPNNLSAYFVAYLEECVDYDDYDGVVTKVDFCDDFADKCGLILDDDLQSKIDTIIKDEMIYDETSQVQESVTNTSEIIFTGISLRKCNIDFKETMTYISGNY